MAVPLGGLNPGLSFPLMGDKARQPRLHHYLPRFYLRAFADPSILRRESKPAIWVYEKGRSPRRGSPDNEACERDLYSFDDDGARNTQAEEWFGRLEGEVAPILLRLQDREHVLTPSERDWLAVFLGTMYLRTPAGRKWHEERVAPTASQYIAECATNPDTFASLFHSVHDPNEYQVDVESIRKDILEGKHETLARRPDLNMAAMVEVGYRMAEILVQLDWQVVHGDGSQFFITSDSPVIPEVRDEAAGMTYFWMGVEHPGANVWFPISRTVCLRLKRDIGSGLCRLPDRGIRMVNKILMRCAHRRIYAAERSPKIEALFNELGCTSSLERSEITWPRI